jgi:hypothetical protein
MNKLTFLNTELNVSKETSTTINFFNQYVLLLEECSDIIKNHPHILHLLYELFHKFLVP